MYKQNMISKIMTVFAETPAVYVCGPRQAGKSTLARAIADRSYVTTYVSLDDPDTFSSAVKDPDGFLAGFYRPLIIDEVQRVPALFNAVAKDVSNTPGPGRILLTGSMKMPAAWDAANMPDERFRTLPLWPPAFREVKQIGNNLVDLLFSPFFPYCFSTSVRFDLSASLPGTCFPEPSQWGEKRRKPWFESYLNNIFNKDIKDLGLSKQSDAIMRFLRRMARLTATSPNYSDMAFHGAISGKMAQNFLELIKKLFLLLEIPAWPHAFEKKQVESPKLLMVDTGLAAYILGLTTNGLSRERQIEKQLIKTFIILELMKNAAWSNTRAQLYHYQSANGDSTDAILEDPAGHVVAMEIKPAFTVSPDDFSTLRFLQSRLGDKFVRGVIVYSGERIISHANNLHAVPIRSLVARHSSSAAA